MSNLDNIDIFKDTERLCKTEESLREAIKKSTAFQELILENDSVNAETLNKFENRAKIIISHKRTLEAAAAYKEMKVAALNFASATNPGGGVVKGASAQEECICRCSTLYFSLNDKTMWNRFYLPHRNERDPLHNDDIIYTPGVKVFKSDTFRPSLMKKEDWYDVDIITCAAPNLMSNPTNRYNPSDGGAIKISDKDLLQLHEKRLRRILDVAASHECEAVILGAFGCGAFRNDPRVVAEASRKVLPDYLHAFKVIEYAIYSRRDDTRNYDAFNGALFRLR